MKVQTTDILFRQVSPFIKDRKILLSISASKTGISIFFNRGASQVYQRSLHNFAYPWFDNMCCSAVVN